MGDEGADGAEVFAFLKDLAGEGAEVVTTHISRVVIGREVVFKLKKPVKLPYLDFSTPALRLGFCEREYALNRRSDPDGLIYSGASRIARRADGSLALDGEGELVDAVVRMRPFDQAGLLDRLAGEGPLPGDLVDRLAADIAALHAAAEVSADRAGAARMARVLDVNAAAFTASGLMDEAAARQLDGLFRAALDRHAALLDSRAAAGLVRRCHGDLHLRNICTIDGRPVIFDCLEFDEDLATTDVLYDLAFLVMDLWHRGQKTAANRVMNRYCDARAEAGGLALMPFLVAVRAAVRAHVTAAAGDAGEAQTYLALVREALAPATPRLLAVGGLSGSGKSTLATLVAPSLGPLPGARILSSDRLRKARFGVAPTERLGPEAYCPEVSTAVYGAMREGAAAVLAAGHAVVADAVHARSAEREAVEAVARAAGCRFTGIWLDVPPGRLKARVAARQGDPSDATVDTVEAQFGYDLGVIGWRRLDAGRPQEELAAEIVASAQA
ncbi:AAA family ATPase [Phreatobacter cathodiphilus]|uniref:Aminoglycoside phosphotransferase n=1 Tax=Phreatobacter cathodiphilus TaxID=1868589 RepID=A0A2S0NC72_9HYPH|nr:AAA family ATPase [Phreatobacter cathodiphilus]AVO45636.1 aminoglycoside phosphotransferase [Phreatobacter cathodiphilus]